MSGGPTLTRRRAVGILGGAVAAAIIGTGIGAFRRGRDGTAPTAPAPGVAADVGLARIGRAYLDRHPDEADASRLRRALPGLDASADDPAALAAASASLEPAVTADFVDGEVVAVDGWILSRTEARLAALVAIVTGT